MQKKRKHIRNIFFVTLLMITIFIAGFLVWAGDYYHAEDIVYAMIKNDPDIQSVDNLIILTPDSPTETGIIFYPGAKVEAISYIPLLQKLKNKGYTCILVKMPLNMAIFHSNAADQIFDRFPKISNWYLAGHSMGGAMASNYASKHQDKVDGLILLGASIYGDYPSQKALTIYGSLNSSVEKNIDYTENIVKIEGGNHAQFGNYGRQKGDLNAAISSDEQQSIAVNAIADFMN